MAQGVVYSPTLNSPSFLSGINMIVHFRLFFPGLQLSTTQLFCCLIIIIIDIIIII